MRVTQEKQILLKMSSQWKVKLMWGNEPPGVGASRCSWFPRTADNGTIWKKPCTYSHPEFQKQNLVVLIHVLIPTCSSCVHLFISFQSFLPSRLKFLNCLQILPLSAFPLKNGSQCSHPPSSPLLCYYDGHLDDLPAFPSPLSPLLFNPSQHCH